MNLQQAAKEVIDHWKATFSCNPHALLALEKALATEQSAEPAVWVIETELADLKSCNGRSIWAENPDIWYDEKPDHLIPLFRHPAGRQTMNLSEILAERGITLQKTFVEKP